MVLTQKAWRLPFHQANWDTPCVRAYYHHDNAGKQQARARTSPRPCPQQGLEPVTGAAWAGWRPRPENTPCGSRGGRREVGGALSLETALMAHASVTVSAEAGGGGVGESFLAGTAAGLRGWGVPQGRAFPIAARAGAGFQGLIHLLADDVHQALEDLLHIDVLLGAGLEELKTKVVGEPPAFLGGHNTLILQVTLVPHEDDLSIVPGVGLDLRGPVLHGSKGLLVGNVIHEQEAHGSTVVGCGDGTVALLARRVPDLQLDPLVVAVDCLDLEVDAHSADKGGREGVIGISEQEGRLAHAAVANEQQLEHVVEVLVRCIPLACWGVSS